MPTNDSKAKVTERDVAIAKWAFSFAITTLASIYEDEGQPESRDNLMSILDDTGLDKRLRLKLNETFSALGEPDPTPIFIAMVRDAVDISGELLLAGKVVENAGCELIIRMFCARLSGRNTAKMSPKEIAAWALAFSGRSE